MYHGSCLATVPIFSTGRQDISEAWRLPEGISFLLLATHRWLIICITGGLAAPKSVWKMKPSFCWILPQAFKLQD